jgi:hypothetical protein
VPRIPIGGDLYSDIGGPAGAELGLLDDYFQQWLHGTERPTILPEDF